MSMKSIKKTLLLLSIIIFGTFQCNSQTDSIYGRYICDFFFTSPNITLYPNNTFSYRSPIDVGYVPETKGYLEFNGDTVFFGYREPTTAIIEKSDSYYNIERKNIIIKISYNFLTNEQTRLYKNKPSCINKESYLFQSDSLIIDSIQDSDSLFLLIQNHMFIPISLNLEKFNEFYFHITLPINPSYYYMKEGKALLKNGILDFSITSSGFVYYNIDVFKKKKDIKKIRKIVYERYKGVLKQKWEINPFD